MQQLTQQTRNVKKNGMAYVVLAGCMLKRWFQWKPQKPLWIRHCFWQDNTVRTQPPENQGSQSDVLFMNSACAQSNTGYMYLILYARLVLVQEVGGAMGGRGGGGAGGTTGT